MKESGDTFSEQKLAVSSYFVSYVSKIIKTLN